MAKFIAPLLSDLLSKYFSNFEADKLSLGWTGNATLSDLILRTDVLDQFNLPFRVIGGRVGTFYLDIGLGGLAKLLVGNTTVVDVTLTDVFILAVPPDSIPFDKEKARASALEKKRNELESMVAKQKAAGEAVGKVESGPGFMQNLVLGIINNVHVKIENIHIRYENNSNPAKPYSFGVILSSLEAETVDKEWKTAKLDFDATFYKLVELKQYGLYWNSNEKIIISANKDSSEDSVAAIVTEMKELTLDDNTNQLQYVVGPLGTKIKAMVTLSPEKLEQPFSLPKADVIVEMAELAIGLSNEQFGEALLLGESLETMQRGMPYLKYRPFNTPHKGHSKEWWQFAYNCVLDRIRRRKNVWGYHNKQKKLIEEYKTAYKAVVLDSVTDEEKAEAKKIEDELDNTSILTIRNQIDLTAAREKQMIKERSGYWSTYVLTEEDLKDILTKDMTDEEKVAFSTVAEEQDKPIVYPIGDDYTEFRANIDLTKTVVNIVNSVKPGDKKDNVMKLVIDNFNLSAETHPAKNGLKVNSSMTSIGITGLEEEGRPLPQLLKSVTNESDNKFLSLTYEKNPFDSKAESRVKFASQNLDVIYHAKTVQKLIDTFKWPVEVELTITSAALASSIGTFKEESMDGIQDMVKDTSEMDLDIKITAPRIMIPEKGELSENSSVLIINLGTLTLKSIPRDGGEGLDISKIAEVGDTEEALSPEILKLTYNEYDVRLSDFEVLLALPGESLDSSSQAGQIPVSILKKGQINVDLRQCLIAKDTRFPAFKVDVQIPMLDVDITESRMLKLMHLALTFPVPEQEPSKPKIIEAPGESVEDTRVGKLSDKTVVQTTGSTEVQPASIEFNPETASQLTTVVCVLHVEGIKLRVSKVDEDAKVVPVLDFLMAEINATLKCRTYGMIVVASLQGITVTYCEAKICGYNGPINFLETPMTGMDMDGTSKNPLLTFNLFQRTDECPKQTSAIVKQRIDARISSLDIILHQEALISLLGAVDKISSEIEKIKAEKSVSEILTAITSGEKENEKKPAAIKVVGLPAPVKNTEAENPDNLDLKASAVLTSFSVQLASEAKRIAQVVIKELVGDFEDGPIKSTILVKLDALEVLNMEPVKYSKILTVTGQEKLLNAKIQMFKELANLGDTEPELGVTFHLGSPRLIIEGGFLGNLINFGNKFQAAKTAVANASAAASKKAAEAVKDAYDSNQLKIGIDLKIGAPEVFLPKNSTSNEALVFVLGAFQINNKLTTVASSSGRNAVLDNITVSYGGVRISRAILNDNSDIQAESVLLEPINFQFDVVRNLSASWYGDLPQFKVAAKLDEFLVRISADDTKFGLECQLDMMSSMDKATAQPAKKDIASVGSEERIQASGAVQGAEESKVEAEPPNKSWMLSLDVSVRRIGLIIYNEASDLKNQNGIVLHDETLSIGELAIQNWTAACELWTNMDISAKIVLTEVLFKDSRPSAGGITDFVQRRSSAGDTTTAPMIAIKFKQTNQNDHTKIYDIDVQTSSVEIVINLNFLNAIMDIVKKTQDSIPKLEEEAINVSTSFRNEDSSDKNKIIAVVSSKADEPKSITLVNAKVVLNEVNIFLLEDVNANDTNAIDLSLSGKFDMSSHEGESHGNGQIKLGCGTTNFRTRSNKKLAEILRPAVINIKLDMTPARKLDVDLKMPELCIKFSAGTILLFVKIASSVGKSFSTEKETALELTDYSGVWQAKKNDEQDYWFMKSEDTDEIQVSGKVEDVGDTNIIEERANVSIGTIALSLEVGAGSMTTPLLAVDGGFAVEATNWSKDLTATGYLRLSAAYNNAQMGAWEYLLEPIEVGETSHRPWEIKFHALKHAATNDNPAPTTHLTLASEDSMEITLTKSGIEALQKVAESFSASADESISEDEVKSTPYTFKNDLESTLTVHLDEGSPLVYSKNDEPSYGNIPVRPGEKINLGLNIHLARDEESTVQAPRILTISIPDFQFNESVNVGKSQSRFFPLNKKSSTGEQYGLIIEVTNENFSIEVTARGILQFTNTLDVPIDISTKGGRIGTAPPLGAYNVPMSYIYENPAGLFIKPQRYGVSPTPLSWISLKKSPKLLWNAQSSSESGAPEGSTLKVVGQTKSILEGNTEEPSAIGRNYVLTIKGQVTINNLLPMQLTFISDAGSELHIEPGRELRTFFSHAGNPNDQTFNLKLPDFRGQSWTSKVHIQPNDKVLTSLIFTSKDRRQTICMGYMTDGKEQKFTAYDTITIYIYCPYWMVNYTGLNLFYQSLDGNTVVSHPAGKDGPVLFGPQRALGAQSMIRCEGSSNSQAIPLDTNTGVPTVIILKGQDREYQLCLSVAMSKCTLTRIVTLSSRYSIINSSPYNLTVRETDVERTTKIPPLQSVSFWPTGRAMRFCASVEDTEEYTPDVSFNENGDSVLRLNNKYGGLRASITQTSTKTNITLSEYNALEVPLLLVNDTEDADIRFNQLGETKIRQVGPGESVLYAWDNFKTLKVLQWSTSGTEDLAVNFEKDQSGEFSYHNRQYKWITFTKYLRRVLVVTENNALAQRIEELRSKSDETANTELTVALASVGISLVNNIAGKDLLYLNIGSMAPTWEFIDGTKSTSRLLPADENNLVENGYQNYMQGVLPAQANLTDQIYVDYQNMTINRPQGLGETQNLRRHAQRPGAEISLKIFPSSRNVEVKVNKIQIDNETIGATYPVCFNIAPPPKTVATTSEVRPPLFYLSLKKLSTPDGSMDLISGKFVLLEFDLRADMGFVDAATAFFKSEADGERKSKEQHAQYKADFDVVSVKETDFYAKQFAKSTSDKKIVIYEDVQLHKLKFNLTFSLTGGGTSNVFVSTFMGLGAALIDLEDRPVDIEGLGLTHVRLTNEEFVDEVYQHYKSLIITTVMSIVFGLDCLGNPMKLLGGVGQGLSTLLTDPSHAAQGVHIIVGSVTESVSGITKTAGKAFDALGLGFLGYGSGLFGQVTQALKDPGVTADGKPILKLQRIRPPRILEPNSIMKPYSQAAANGALLGNQVDPTGQYLYHASTGQNNPETIIVTSNMVSYVEVHIDKKTVQRTLWNATLSSIGNVQLQGNALKVQLKQVSQTQGYGFGFAQSAPPPQVLQPVFIDNPENAQVLLSKIQSAMRNQGGQQPPSSAPQQGYQQKSQKQQTSSFSFF